MSSKTIQTQSTSYANKNPCLTCGACCAFYKVTFYWRERSDEMPNGVPVSLCEDLNSHKCVMKGTNQPEPRCPALIGTIGRHVFCSIYWRRPNVCREIDPSYKHGHPEPKCDKARSHYGLPPLTPEYWQTPEIYSITPTPTQHTPLAA